MTPDWSALLVALHEIGSAETEDECVARIAIHAADLFGPARLRLSSADAELGGGLRFALRPDAPGLGALVVPAHTHLEPELARRIETFAGHAGLALRTVRRLEEYEHQSRRDALTGLRNYREFSETLSRLLPTVGDRRGQPVGLVVIDLDRFKDVNDEHGHAAGDRLLRATAGALSAVCRAADRAYRIGGDEFALLLPGAGPDQARRAAERAHAAVTRLTGSLGASWGAAAAPADGASRDELTAAADHAMYKRKRPGVASALATGHTRRRLGMVARLTTRLTAEADVKSIAAVSTEELHGSFGYFLAVIHRLDADRRLRVVAGSGPLAESDSEFLAWEQSIDTGVNGRVARSGHTSVVPDTRLDPDYLAYDSREDPGSEVSVPIVVGGEVWGVLNLEQLASHAFDESDVHLAEAVVAVTAAAIDRCLTVARLADRAGLTAVQRA